MIALARISRRRFVATSSLAMAAVVMTPALSALATPTPPRVLFDPAIDAAVRFAAAAHRQGSDCHALAGDRYRFVLDVLAVAGAPRSITGITTYADFLLLTGTLQEARYRLIGPELHEGTEQGNGRVSWLMQPRST